VHSALILAHQEALRKSFCAAGRFRADSVKRFCSIVQVQLPVLPVLMRLRGIQIGRI
jgi:hypothetical protein